MGCAPKGQNRRSRMSPNLLFSGPIGSGKTSISKQVASSLGYGWNGFGATVKRIAMERSIPIEREKLQALGEHLITSDPNELCRRVMQEAGSEAARPVIIDGLRHAHIRNILERLSSPRGVVCIYVHVDDVTRFDRIAERDGSTPEKIRALDLHSTEVEVGGAIRDLADFVADNNREASVTCTTILEWLEARHFLDLPSHPN